MVVLVTIAIFALAMTGMALGVIISNRRLKGSCGGLTGGACVCEESQKAGLPPPAACPKDLPESAPRVELGWKRGRA